MVLSFVVQCQGNKEWKEKGHAHVDLLTPSLSKKGATTAEHDIKLDLELEVELELEVVLELELALELQVESDVDESLSMP